jgi:FAD/FMN-containing dehydrogenase/Fe-S oxidoreductase
MNKIEITFLEELRKLGFAGDITNSKANKVIYATDNSIYELVPSGIIFPKNVADVELIFQLLKKDVFHIIKITARGGGTSTNGQSINDGFIVDYSRYMKNIISIDVENMTAEVQPGVILDQLNAEVKKHNLYFPPEISPSNRATIGGMVNTDACGQGSCAHGRTSDNILDLTIHSLLADHAISSNNPPREIQKHLSDILSEAKDIYSSKHLSRTATGYNIEKSYADERLDLNYLISGSEGTLVLVSKITVKLKKLPIKKRLVLLCYNNFDNALSDAEKLASLTPNAVETVDENVIRLARKDIIWQKVGAFIGENDQASINIVEFDYDNIDSFNNHKQELGTKLQNLKLSATSHFFMDDEKQIADIWELRKKGVGLLGAMKGSARPIPFVEDTIVPTKHLAEYVKNFRAILEKHQVKYGMFGHVDAGCLHVRPALDMKQLKNRQLIRQITDEVAELLLRYNGLLWGEHGKGFRGEYANKFFNEKVLKTFAEIKSYFDPFNQLNHGKISSGTNGQIASIDSINTRGKFDEKITAENYQEFENILNCNGNALCFNLDKSTAMCPSYKVTNNRVHSPKGRAMLFKEWMRLNKKLPSLKQDVKVDFLSGFFVKIKNSFRSSFDKEVYDSFSKCLGCKACNSQCPIKVNIPDAKAFFLHLFFTKHFRKPQDYLIANIEKVIQLFGKFPKISNLFLQNIIVKTLLKTIFGISHIIAIKPPKESFAAIKSDKKVYLLREAYTNYYLGNELVSAFNLLSKLGFEVRMTKIFENGKALHAKGFLNQFRKVIKKNISYFETLENYPMLSIDPSITLSYQDEYQRFSDKELQISYLPNFLNNLDFTAKLENTKHYHLILHCSEQSNIANITTIWKNIFSKFGVSLNVIQAGCCGMSGSFGSETQHASDSKNIFQDNWQETVERLGQDTNNIIMVSGSSCKSQIERFSKYKVSNPLTIISEA